MISKISNYVGKRYKLIKEIVVFSIKKIVNGNLKEYEEDEISGYIPKKIRKDVRHNVVLSNLHGLHQQQDHLLLQRVTPV